MSTGDGVNHNTKVVIEQGGDVMDVQDGGVLDVQDGAEEKIEGLLSVKDGGVLNIESGGQLQIDGVAVTATAEEINAGSGSSASSSIQDLSTGATPRHLADKADFAIAAGASGVSNVTLTVKDGAGNALTRSSLVDVWLSDSVAGVGLASHTPDTSLTVVTNGTQMASLVANKMLRCLTKNDGTLTLAIADATKTHYYVAASIRGDVSVSAQLSGGSYGA